MYILGISAFYHDSSACLLKDGIIVVAVEEERFTRKKHDNSFPKKAIEFCLSQENITIDQIDLIVYYEKPFLKFDRILSTIKRNIPFGFTFFKDSINTWVKSKLWIPQIIKNELKFNGEVIFCEHHESHAAGAFYTSLFNEAAIVTIDGVGEKATIIIAKGEEDKIEIIKEQHYPNSFGLLYSAFTQYCGFKVNSGEYKLMGLSPYGKPIYKDLILSKLITISNDAVLSINMKYFAFENGKSTINDHFCKLFGMPVRKENEPFTPFYFDIANSIQSISDDYFISLAKYAKKIVGTENLCLSGGVALNCKSNGFLLKENIFKNIWIQPSPGDGGASIGAAFVGWYQYHKNPRRLIPDNLKNQVYLGSSYNENQIQEILDKNQIIYQKFSNQELVEKVSLELSSKKIIGWFQGKMEFGPRALGNRSILASPLFGDMKEFLNSKIKLRESFRPFAPVIIEDKASQWFDTNIHSKYMLFTFESDKKNVIPSCIHEDNTARLQTISKEDNPLFYELIAEFEKITQVPILINTSFNVRGEPIVENPFDALYCFFSTEIDVLVLGNFIVEKVYNKTIPSLFKEKRHYEKD